MVNEQQHIHHLIAAYAHGQLTPTQQRRVRRHLQYCPDCRAAVDREMGVANDLRTFMPRVGQPSKQRVRALFPAIWRQSTRRSTARLWQYTVLPAYGMAVTALLVVCVLLGSALFVGPGRAVASPMSPADVKATNTPIFTGEPTQIAVQAASEASMTAVAAAAGVDVVLPVSPVPVASVMP